MKIKGLIFTNQRAHGWLITENALKQAVELNGDRELPMYENFDRNKRIGKILSMKVVEDGIEFLGELDKDTSLKGIRGELLGKNHYKRLSK